MSVNSSYQNSSLRTDASIMPRPLPLSSNTAFRKLPHSNQQGSKPPLPSLKGRITAPETVPLRSPLLDPDATIEAIELVLINWEENAEPGEDRGEAKDAIMKFLLDSNLNHLTLSSYKLQTLPDVWNVSLIATRLTGLDLSCNHLPYLPSTFGDLKRLQSLSLERNCLIRLPKEISDFELLQQLNIAYNPILQSIPRPNPGCLIQISKGSLDKAQIEDLGKSYTIDIK